MSDLPQGRIIGLPLGTRAMRLERHVGVWKLWLATRDYVNGTYLLMHDNGACQRVIIREGEPNEITSVKPPDRVVRGPQ